MVITYSITKKAAHQALRKRPDVPLTFLLVEEPDKVVGFHDLEVLDDAGIQRLGLFAVLLLHAFSKVRNGSIWEPRWWIT